MNKSIGKGSLVLIASALVCKLLGAFFRLPLTSILGIEGIGVFQMIMSMYSFVLILTSGGVATALSKHVSQARAVGDYQKIKSLLKTAVLYSFIFGALGGGILCAFCRPISMLQGASSSCSAYLLMALIIPLGGMIAAFRGFFQGYENMFPTAMSQVLEQIFKFALGLCFSFILGKRGIQAGVFGAFLGIATGEIVALVFLYVCLKIKVKLPSEKSKSFSAVLLKSCVPLSFGAAVLPFVSALDSFIVVSRLVAAGFSAQTATALFGLQTGVVGAILNFPLIISTSICAAMLPVVSYMQAQFDEQRHQTIAKTLKIMWFVLLPLVSGICCICKPLYQLFYSSLSPQMLDYAVRLTCFGAASVIVSALMQFYIALLQAKGKFGFCLTAYAVGGLLKVVCVYVLCGIESINIFGVVVGNIALSATVCVMAIIKNRRKISMAFFDMALPLLASVAMALSLSLFTSRLAMSNLMQIVFSIAVGSMVYALLTYPILSEIICGVFGKAKAKTNNTNQSL